MDHAQALDHAVRKHLDTIWLQDEPSEVYQQVIDRVALIVVQDVVKRCDDNYLKASRILGVSRMTLRNKLGFKPDRRYAHLGAMLDIPTEPT